MMRILALLFDAYGSEGGIAEFNRTMLDALTLLGEADPFAVWMRADDLVARPPARLRWLEAKRHARYDYVAKAIEASVRHRPDVVISGHLNITPLALTLARLNRARLCTITHGTEIFRHPGFLRAMSLSHSNRVIAVSEFSRRALLGWARLDPERVDIVGNTADENRFNLRPPVTSLLEEHRLRRDLPIVLTVSRLVPHKRHDFVLHAIARLRSAGRSLQYVIVGKGAEERRLRDLVSGLDLDPLVRFVGFESPERIKQWYSVASVFAMPSSGDGFGIVLLEAALSGVAPVVLQNTAPAEVANKLKGFTVPENNLDAFCDALESASRLGRDERLSLRAAAIAHYGRNRFINSITEVLKKLGS